MPLYEYKCGACGQRFELIQKFSDPAPESCRVCGKGPVERQQASPAIQFKGTGWYITDYSQKGKAPAESSGGTSESKDGSGKSDKPAGDKPAAEKSTGSDAAKPAASPSASSKTEA